MIEVVRLDTESAGLGLIGDHASWPSGTGVRCVDAFEPELKYVIMIESIGGEVDHRDPAIFEDSDLDTGDPDRKLGTCVEGDQAGGGDRPDRERVGVWSDPEGE